MINTVNTKREQLENGYFKTGSGKETVLIIGSCRTVPYVGYLDKWNNENGNRFTICFADPYNWMYDINDNRTDYESVLSALEWDERILEMLKSVDIFVHEYYANFGMFNTDKNAFKNIYKFGLSPKIDVCLPNFNDYFILTADIVSFDTRIKKMAIADYNVIGKLSDATLTEIKNVRENNLQKFYNVCSKTSFPEFAEIFSIGYKQERLFWNSNHVAKMFTLTIFKLLDSKFLKLEMTKEFLSNIWDYDMFANNYTFLTEYDTDFKWNEEIKSLREYL